MNDKIYKELFNLVSTLEEISDYDETLELITNHVRNMFDADEASVIMINPRTENTIKTIFSYKNDNKVNIKLLHDLVTGWILKNKKSFNSNDPEVEPNFTKTISKESNKVTIFSVPIKSGGKIIGTIFLMGKSLDENQTGIEMLENYSSVVSPFLSNTQNIYQYFTPSLSDNSLIAKYKELGLIGKSPEFLEVLKSIEVASKCSVRVIIQGGSGTGKELVAKAIHKMSNRADKKFVAVDCGAIPTHLIESELFGHVKGAFTGADSNRKGLIEEADGGTFFMDEITNLPFETQSKLLRVLQENEIRPLGSNQANKVDVRIITATSSSINVNVEKGQFREDLFYRIFVYPISIPSLKERNEDIPLLTDYFLEKFCTQQKKSISVFSDDAMTALVNHEWKGNIRELENYVERIVAQAGIDKMEIEIEDLPGDIRDSLSKNIEQVSEESGSLIELVSKYEANIIRDALNNVKWNQSEAARRLGIPEQTLRYKMKKLNITKNLTDY